MVRAARIRRVDNGEAAAEVLPVLQLRCDEGSERKDRKEHAHGEQNDGWLWLEAK